MILKAEVTTWPGYVQVVEPKKAPKGRRSKRAAVAEAEAADVHAEEIEIIDDDDEDGAEDSAASQVSAILNTVPIRTVRRGARSA